MCFLWLTNWCFQLLWAAALVQIENCAALVDAKQMPTPLTFSIRSPEHCQQNEFYNVNYFECFACNETGESAVSKLQTSADRFSCLCPIDHISIYEKNKRWPMCYKICANTSANCTAMPPHQLPLSLCSFQYLNSTSIMDNLSSQAYQQNAGIILAQINPDTSINGSDCQSCNAIYNFQYQNYCLANSLMRQYLHYNAYWQSTSKSSSRLHFGQLKFVAFFCMALNNDTACQQLANLCVLSHYSMEKHSPCSAFLLTQMSDMVIKYAHASEPLRILQPFLFYRKGKSTRELLTKTLQLSNPAEVELFSTNYDLSGRLQRWGAFKLDQLNLCHGQKAPTLRLAQHQVPLECQLSLEQLIDLASQQANDNYLSLYLNFSSNNQFLLHQLPVLIETLSPENQRLQQEEWQLVKRFQLISAQPKFNRQHGMLPRYEDAHKLQLYRSLRYLSQVELQYTVHPGQRIGLPLLRLNYRNIEIADNASLKQLHPFQLSISFVDSRQRHKTQLLLKLALPLLLLWAFAAALFRLQNLRRRRAAELCNNLVELLLQLSGNVAKALLMTALMLLTVQAYNYNQLAWLSYSAFLLQLMFLGVHLRRISQLDVFLIDWERPRSSSSYEGQGQRMNLDSSSLCSSVRTYVAESSVSAWRILFTANAWIRLSASQSYSTLLQAFAIIALQQLCTHLSPVALDLTLQTALISGSYLVIYAIQILVHRLLLPNPLQKFVDLCSQANVSLFSLLDPSYGYYIHGRSPHGFADTDMSSMILQLQREGQNMCGRRGLLMDSDKQAYIILPPRNLHIYLERLLLPLQRSRHGSLSQTLLYQKDIPSIDGQVERTSIAYASVNRFFCAFIDHAIKDMDYIIKEKSLVEKLCNCEIDNYLTENKGTFYIDDYYTFSHALLLGNHFNIFVLELLILLSIFMLTSSLLIATALICVMNKLLRYVFIKWVRCNVSRKTLIDERFLL